MFEPAIMQDEEKVLYWQSCIPIVHLMQHGGLLFSSPPRARYRWRWAEPECPSWQNWNSAYIQVTTLKNLAGFGEEEAERFKEKFTALFEVIKIILTVTSDEEIVSIKAETWQEDQQAKLKKHFSGKLSKQNSIKIIHSLAFKQFIDDMNELRSSWTLLLDAISSYPWYVPPRLSWERIKHTSNLEKTAEFFRHYCGLHKT